VIWRQLRHSNILPIIGVDASVYPRTIRIIMPYVGLTLKDYVLSSSENASVRNHALALTFD
jgi:hypothetical protein